MTRFRPLHSSARLLGLASMALVAACSAAGSDASVDEPPTSTLANATLTNLPAQANGHARHARWFTSGSTQGAATSTAPAPTPAPTSGTAPTPTPTPAPGTTSTPGPTPSPTPAPSPSPTTSTPYRGVNLDGADFGSALPGKLGIDYTWPTSSEVDYYMGKGMSTFRIGFTWERLQPTAYGNFDATYAAALDKLVTYATGKGAYVLLNPQNFARYYGNTVGSSQVPNAVFADFWTRLASKYSSNSHVMFGLVNEPNTMATEQWVGAANAAIQGIRSTGATNVITVPGNAWTGAWTWYDTSYGTSNAVALLKIVDPANNVVFEAHQYLDTNGGGEVGTCVSTTVGSERLAPFIKWLRDNGKKGLIAEFAGGANTTCNTAVTNMLNTIKAASDVLEGWLWWGGGPDWGNYIFALDPSGGVDAPQMGVLAPFLVW
jgi:endoglucanase